MGGTRCCGCWELTEGMGWDGMRARTPTPPPATAGEGSTEGYRTPGLPPTGTRCQPAARARVFQRRLRSFLYKQSEVLQADVENNRAGGLLSAGVYVAHVGSELGKGGNRELVWSEGEFAAAPSGRRIPESGGTLGKESLQVGFIAGRLHVRRMLCGEKSQEGF